MNTLHLIVFTLTYFVFAVMPSQCQSFAPIGAVWHYNEIFSFSNDTSYIEIKVIGDTIIDAKTCKILKSEASCMNGEITYVHDIGDSVFAYNVNLDSFQLIYNFSEQQGESWNFLISDNIANVPDTFFVFVDSTSIISINGVDLIKQFVSGRNTSGLQSDYSSEIIQFIGDLSFLFYAYPYQNAVCDVNYPSGLRCYEDTLIGFYQNDGLNPCTYENALGISEISDKGNSALRLAYVSSQVKVDNNNLTIHAVYPIKEVSVFNLLGQSIAFGKNMTGENSMNLELNNSGIYLIHLGFENHDETIKVSVP